jgi:lipopolysaccharide export LptBFGC system permease protein LptF
MNASHRRTAVRHLQRPQGIAGYNIWRRVPIVDVYLFGHLWRAAREGAAMFAGLAFVFAIVELSTSHFGKSSASVPIFWAYLPLLLPIGAGLALLHRKAS